jgi:Flp pilus assembly protein TadD
MNAQLLTFLTLFCTGCATYTAAGKEISQQWEASADPETIQMALAERLIAANRVDAGLSIIADLKRNGSTEIELDLLQGIGLMMNNKPLEATRILEDYQKARPDDYRSHTALGLLYADGERIEEAMVQLKRSIELEPNDAAVHNNLGFLQMSVKQYENAHISLEKATTLDATQPKYLTNLAYNLVALGRTDEALSAFLSVATKANAHAQFALALELKGATDLAINHYETALQLEPSHHAAVMALNRLTPTSLE